MIDRKNRLKALELKNVAVCSRYLLGPIEGVSIIDFFTFAKVHYTRERLDYAHIYAPRQVMNFHWKFSLCNLSELTNYFYNRSESEWRCITILVGLSEYKGFLINLIHITCYF